MAGLDLAMGYGGFSLTAAFTYGQFDGSDVFVDEEWMIWLLQAGYLFQGTAWEVALRWSSYIRTISAAGGDLEPKSNEFALAINYYLNGHANKLTLDAAYFDATADGGQGGGYFDMYSGVPWGFGSDTSGSWLFRFQWQLAL